MSPRASWADKINQRAEVAPDGAADVDRLVALVAARHVSIRDRRDRDGRVLRDGSGRVTREVWADGDMIGERKSWVSTRRLALCAGELAAAGDFAGLAALKRTEMDRERKVRS